MQLHPPSIAKICGLLLAMTGCLAWGVAYSPSSDDYVMQVWTTDSGLPNSSVTSITQTPDGYLWVGTLHGGLARFDGSSFVVFQPGNTPELKSIEIHKLLVDQSGTLWIGNVEGGLISCRHGRFKFEYWNNDTPRSWLAGIVAERPGEIEFSAQMGLIFRCREEAKTNDWQTLALTNAGPASVFCEDSNGIVWYRTRDNQLAQLRGTHVVPLSHPPGLNRPEINALARDVQGRLWVATPNHLACWNGDAFVDQTPTNELGAFTVKSMLPCPDGGFWIQTQNYLRKFDGRRWTVTETVVANGGSQEWPAAAPYENFALLFADSRGGAWFWRRHGGLGHISRTGEISWVRDADGKPLGPVQSWFEDLEGDVWVGLGDGGLVRLRPRLFHVVWPKENVDSKLACSVCQDENGVMWFGTGGKQIVRWKADEGMAEFEPPVAQFFAETKVLAAGDDQLWVGSVQNGLMKFHAGVFARPFPAESIGTVVRCLYQDSLGNLWIGSEFGLFRWDGMKLKCFTGQDGFPPADVLAITGDAAGNLWIGTALGELRCLRNGKFQAYLPKDSLTDKSLLEASASADPLSEIKRGTLTGGERFWSLRLGDDGVLWIGSLGGGLLRFQDGQFTRFTTRDDLPSDYINQVLTDERGQLWLGTRAGVVRVSQQELNAYALGGDKRPNFVTYDRTDGLPALECTGGSQPNCWRSQDGRLWFTTVRGAVWIDPANLRINHLPPPIHIEDIRVDGASLVEKSGATAPSSTPVPATIRVAAGRHYFEFKFSAVSLVAPEKMKFKWRLAGLETRWVDGGIRREASYNYIPPGNYRFEIVACNNDGIWNEQAASVNINVLPFFWQRWWFRSAVILLLLAAALTVYFVRISRLRSLERLRLRIACDLHDEVGANLGSISLLANMMVKNPSSSDALQVRAIAIQTIDTLRDIIWFINPSHDRLGDLVAKLQETARVMLPTITLNFDQAGDFNSVDLPLAFRRNVPPLFKETLHNILKHSQATTVHISFSCKGDEFQFAVKDNGIGFDPTDQRSGNGLKNLALRAAEINGRLHVESLTGAGTTVTLAAPIRQKHGLV